jgi:hypothetical protein
VFDLVNSAADTIFVSDEDDSLIVLQGPGWQQLPDGSWQLPVECPTLVHYITLPKTLQFGPHKVRKCGWDSDRKYAYYRDTGAEQAEVMQHLM